MEPCIIGQHSIFVEDLIPHIIDHLVDISESNVVAPLALISSAWVAPVRRALYAFPKLRTYHSCYLLSRTLTDSPHFGNRIRALHLHPVTRKCALGEKCECRNVNAISLSLAPLFRLEDLLDIYLGGDCAIHAEWYLKSFVKPEAVRKLRVEGMQWYWSFDTSRPVTASLRWTEGLASRYKNLKCLELVNLDLRICELHSFRPYPPHLETLHIDRVRITSGKLSYLAYNAWESLRKLIIIVPEYKLEYDVEAILTQASQKLQIFKYFIKDGDRQHDLQTVIGTSTLASCSFLVDLQLSLPFGPSTLQELGSQLARLETLKVFGNYETDVEEWSVGISNGIFPSLRELHLPIGHEMRRLADWQWPALRAGTARKACEARNISLAYVYLTE